MSTAPNEGRALIVIPCQSGKTWFYVNPLDGSEIRKLTDFTLGASNQLMDLVWSPDGKAAFVTIADRDGRKADIFRFDIEEMLVDPLTQPVRLTTDEAMKYGVVWQPVP